MKKKPETAQQWATRDPRSPSDRAIDAYLRTPVGSLEALKRLDEYWSTRGLRIVKGSNHA